TPAPGRTSEAPCRSLRPPRPEEPRDRAGAGEIGRPPEGSGRGTAECAPPPGRTGARARWPRVPPAWRGRRWCRGERRKGARGRDLLPALEANLHAFQKPVAFGLGLDFGVLRERKMHEPPLPRSQGRKQRGSPRAANLLRGLARELFERVLAVRPEAVRVEPRVDRLAQPLGGDAAHEDLETREAFALVGEERLDVVADQLEEQLVALRIATA